jgi:hypothetical protein
MVLLFTGNGGWLSSTVYSAAAKSSTIYEATLSPRGFPKHPGVKITCPELSMAASGPWLHVWSDRPSAPDHFVLRMVHAMTHRGLRARLDTSKTDGFVR